MLAREGYGEFMKKESLVRKVIREEGDGFYPDPQRVLVSQEIKVEVLKSLVGESVLSARQFNLELLRNLCTFAAYLEKVEIAPHHPLDGKVAITAFFEASTRTRLSFESAMLRLGGKVLSVPDGQVTGIAKGESLSDIGEMFNSYGDALIMRHTDTNSVQEVMENLRIPLINAGNGSGEHPTQALADWYALLKWRPELAEPKIPEDKKIHLGIIGTPGSMRAVKSFLLMALPFKQAVKKITVISEMADPFGADVLEDLKQSNINYEACLDLNEVITKLDVIYMNSIAFLGDSYKTLDKRYKLTKDSNFKSGAVVMHPLARRDEIHPNLDSTSYNLYFSQASGAVFIRQALLTCIFDRLERIPFLSQSSQNSSAN